jgi:excisionase family DNA binding protein
LCIINNVQAVSRKWQLTIRLHYQSQTAVPKARSLLHARAVQARNTAGLDPPQQATVYVQEQSRMTHSHATPTLLTVEETADRLRVKPATIRAWILRGVKVEVVKIGRCVRITERSVDKLIDDNTKPPRN